MFQIPTLQELAERTRQAFRAHLPGSDAWLWPNNIYATAKVVAGAVYELFGFADYIQRQKFALTADSENLDRHGEEIGLARRPAQPARGLVRLTATGALTVAANAVFRRADDVEYRTLTGGALAGTGTLDVDCVASSDGKLTSAEAATPLEIVSGVTGTATAAVGPDGIMGGADVEDDEAFRARILFRKRNPPHGGSAADYVLWASEVAGVTRVFVERRWNGVGTVRVFPLMDDLYSDGIAPAAEIARVADHLDARQPSGTIVAVTAPAAVPIAVEIAGLTPDTVAVREAVKAELRAAFRRLSKVAGADTPNAALPFLATPQSFSRSWLWQAVANASGEQRHIINVPATDVALTPGQIATLGAVTFVEA